MTEYMLAKKIAEETGLTLLASKKFIKTYKEVVTENLCRYGRIQFFKFGTYRIFYIKSNIRRDLVTKEFKEFPAVKSVRFKFSRKVINRVNAGKKETLISRRFGE